VWKYRTTHLRQVHVKTCSFLRTLWQKTSPGSTGKARRLNSNRHSGRVPCLRDQSWGARCKAKQRSYYWRFLILRVSYTASPPQTGKQLTSNSTWSCNVCVNQFAENDRKNGRRATGSCTTTIRPHILHILCRGFWLNTASLRFSSRHTHQISHRVTFFYSQGLRKFWKDTDLRERMHQTKFDEDTIRHPERGVRKMFPTVAETLGEVCSCGRLLCWR